MALINYLKHCLRSVIQFQQQREQILSHIFFYSFLYLETKVSIKFIPDCQVMWNQFQIFTAQTFSKYWHCYQIFLDMLFRHHEDTLGCLVNEIGKKMARLFFKTSQCIFFMVLIAFCFRYVYFVDYLNWHSIQIFLTNNLRYQDFKSLLEKNYI